MLTVRNYICDRCGNEKEISCYAHGMVKCVCGGFLLPYDESESYDIRKSVREALNMMSKLPRSIVRESQKLKFSRDFESELYNSTFTMDLVISYDNELNKCENTFSMIANCYKKSSNNEKEPINKYVCNDKINDVFPEYAKYLKWHLTSSTSPFRYSHTSNNKNNKKVSQHKTSDEVILDSSFEDKLKNHIAEFKKCIEELSFVY